VVVEVDAVVGDTGRIVQLEVPVPVVESEHRNPVGVVAVPITRHRDVTGVEGVAEVHEAVRAPVQCDLVDVVAVEVTREQRVARVAEGKGVVGCTEPGGAVAEVVDDVEALLLGAVDRHRVLAIAIEVTDDRGVARLI